MPFEIDPEAVLKLLAPIVVALLGAWAKRHFEGHAKLVTYLVHAASNPLPPPSQQPPPPQLPSQPVAQQTAPVPPVPAPIGPPPITAVNTHAVVVRNVGKKTANNVRIDHAVFPLSFGVHPPIRHTVTRQGDGAEVLFPVLVPGEQVTISYLYFPPLTWDRINGWVKCDEGMARAINVIPSTPPPRGVRWVLNAFTFVGASALLYWIFKLIRLYIT